MAMTNTNMDMNMDDAATDAASVTGFLEALGSSAPTPGGGAASALVGAIATALAEMVAQLTVGRPKFQAAEEQARDVLEQARSLRAELLRLMDEDARAYAGVAAAYRMPKGSAEERAARDAAIQRALDAAMQPPLAIMERGCAALALAEPIAAIGNPTVASDVGCAALLGEAAVRAAGLNVLANVVLLRDAAAGAEARARVAEMEARAGELRERAMATVGRRMGL
jgi:formiminotetrahydrofolate cyclodeaminase